MQQLGLLLHAQTMVGISHLCTNPGSPTPQVHIGQDRAGTCFSVFVLQKDPLVISWSPTGDPTGTALDWNC